MPKILILDDDTATIAQIQPALEAEGYTVTVDTGIPDLALIPTLKPDLILLEVGLENGADFVFLEQLRRNSKTRHFPVILVSQLTSRADKIRGLELGADDYVTKPVEMAAFLDRIEYVFYGNPFDRISQLPTGIRIEKYLRRLLHQPRSWAYLDIRLGNFDAFTTFYGWKTAEDVLRFCAAFFKEVIQELGTPDDYIGHVGRDRFIIITYTPTWETLQIELKACFDAQIYRFYTPENRQHELWGVADFVGQPSWMFLIIGAVSSALQPFKDIREITELAEANWRGNTANDDLPPDTILTSW